jgi:uncharacterized membrane protein YdbT with pleckstrin-like domain
VPVDFEAEGLSEEKVVWSGKPTVLAFYDALVGGVLLVAVSILLLATPLSTLPWLSALGVVCGGALILVAFMKAWANSYVLTEKCVRRSYRFVTVRVEEAPIEKITNTVVEQDVVGRILNFGDVRFDTAGTSFAGVLFKGVKNPEGVKKSVDERLKAQLTPNP